VTLMEDWSPRGVFGSHPHRGIETVTYVVEGRIGHSDNQGHEGTILPGDVRWMIAGRGLIHNEIPAEGVTVHSLQLWVNLPAADKMTGPRCQNLAGDAVPVGRQPGVVVRAFRQSSRCHPPTVLADSAILFHSTESRLPVRTLKSVLFPSRQKRISNRRRPNRRSVSVTSGSQSGSAGST
jgi:redox-sensitive bicupin YhaK (pirin superfamily)